MEFSIIEKMKELIKQIFLKECSVHAKYQLYCPGCGGTRAAIALLEGNIIESVRYNPITLLLIIDVVLMTIIDLVKSISKGKYVFSRIRFVYNVAFLAFIVIYSVLRNYLLVIYDIDWVGDFI